MLPSLENDPEVLLDRYYVTVPHKYVYYTVLSHYVLQIMRNNFSGCRKFDDLACNEFSVIHIYNVRLVLHYLLICN